MLGQSNTNTIATYIKIENEDITVTQNGVYEAGEEYTGLGTVTVNVESTIDNQDKSVTPTTSQQSITADQGYTGLGTVTVGAVTSAIDPDIISTNIKQGVNILGVSGSVVELNPTTTTVTPTTSAQTITPEGGYNGFSTVNVNAVTSSIDSNISAGNIKSGVSILGVQGSVEELNGTTLSVTPTAVSQSHTPTAPNNAFTSVSVAGDQNLVAENIVKDVTIFGVTGSYEGSVINNQDLTVTENGTYTHDAGYTGLGTVSVNVPAGTIVDGQNTLGYDINADTKVWVNATEHSNYEYSNGYLDNGILTLYQFGSLNSYASGQPSSFNKIETIIKCKIPQINTGDTEVKYVSALCSTGIINTDVESGGETEWLNMDIVLYAGNGKYYIVAEMPNVPNARIEAQSGSALYNFDLNDWLYLKFEKDLDTLKLWYSSDDGETWTLFGSVNNISITPNACSYIGFYAGNETEQGVQYDLSECKVIFDNIVYWTPETTHGYQIIPSNLIDVSSVAGVTNETILANTSGEVKILQGTGSYEPYVSTKTITTNGTYNSQLEGFYGYNEVNVNVQFQPSTKDKTITQNGVYNISSENHSYVGFEISEEIQGLIGNYYWCQRENVFDTQIGDNFYNGQIIDEKTIPDFNTPIDTVDYIDNSWFITYDFDPSTNMRIYPNELVEISGHKYFKQNAWWKINVPSITVVGDYVWVDADSLEDISVGTYVYNSTDATDTAPDTTTPLGEVTNIQPNITIGFTNLSYLVDYPSSSNTTYDEHYDGYREVTVSVPSGVNNQNKTVSIDGTYTADQGYTGLGEVVVTAGAVIAAEIEAQLHEINSGSSEESYSGSGM